MLTPLALALIVLQSPSPPSAAQQAYLDEGARELVAKAREYRERVDRSITRYQTRVLERISMGVTVFRRERLMYRREIATRVDWRRDGVSEVEIEGAREVIPVAFRDVRLPDDLRGDAVDYAFDPASNRFDITFTDDSSDFFFHPLGRDAELHYRYRSGDTTRIRLQDGRTLVLAQLGIIPAVDDVHHLRGTIWIDTDSNAMVRGVFTLADEFRFARDIQDEDDDVPAFLNVIRAEVKYFTIEYGLWELRWWLPRIVAFEGTASIGSLAHFPLRYEVRYGEYSVEGDTTVAYLRRSELPEIDPDSAAEACFERGYCRCEDGECRNFRVIVPDDTVALLTSERLPPSIYARGESVMSPVDIQALEDALRTALPSATWQVGRPTLAWGMGAGMVRYNRVEALSVGARAGIDFGKLSLEGQARLGVADLEPNAELHVLKPGLNTDLRLGAYRRLDAMNPETRPLAFGNSFNALVLGRDDGEYFRAAGVELLATPADPGNRSWEVRLFAEAQRPADVETDFSVPHIFDGDHRFRGNRAAEHADQIGASAVLRYDRGLDPAGIRWGVQLDALGSAGTFDFARGALTTNVTFPIGAALTASLEAAAGWSGGTVPVQSQWYLGGPGSLRGYAGAVEGGETFWRGRVELGYGFPGARLALFGDAGRAGPRELFDREPSLIGAGVGGSFMDGLIRVDLARALRSPTGWRLDLYLDGLL